MIDIMMTRISRIVKQSGTAEFFDMKISKDGTGWILKFANVVHTGLFFEDLRDLIIEHIADSIKVEG